MVPASDDARLVSMSLRTLQLALFAAPAIPIAALGMPLVVYLPPFYAEDLGLGLSIVGTVFMGTRLWDIATDLMMGTLTDQVRTRWGRRRPWIVLAVPILLVAVWRLFLPDPGVGWFYLLIWLVVLYVGWTMLTISHMAWGAELSDDYHVRSRLQAWRQAGLLGGMILVLALPAWIEQQVGGGGVTRANAIGWFILALLPITVGVAVVGVGERAVRDTGEKASTLAAFKLALGNKLMVRLLIADVCAGIAPGVTASLYLFFVEHVMELGTWSSLLLLAYFASGFISVPIWLRLSYRFGKHRTFAAAMVYMGAVLPLVLLLSPGDLYLCAAANIVYGLGYGAAPVLLRSIVADITDDDALRSGTQRTGLFYSLLTMTNKLGFAISVGVAYPLLEVVGFDPHLPVGENSSEALIGLQAIYVTVPVICFLIAAYAMWRFPLDETKQNELRDAVDAAGSEG